MPLLVPPAEGRYHIFHQLKPQCVALSQSALALNGAKSNVQDVTDQLDKLHHLLQSCTIDQNQLDAKLADYVFFPVSQVLKVSQKISIRCLELCLEILAILCRYGWRHSIQPQLVAQVVIFCTLMAERHPKGFEFSSSTEELQTAAFWCLHHVSVAASQSRECRTFFTSEANFPQMGQTISTTLDGILEAGAVETQLAASNALKALIVSVIDPEMSARFLPGLASKLTKILTPTTKLRRNYQVLIICLETMTHLLRATLADDVAQPAQDGVKQSIIDDDWKAMAARQLEPVLNSIMRLKIHGHEDVRVALAKLCLMLLERCRQSLASCSAIAIETVLSIASSQAAVGIQLEMLLRVDPSLSGLLKNTMYDWLSSLSTIVQGADEVKKVQKMQQLRTAYSLLHDSGSNTDTLEGMLASRLRDTVVLTLQAPISKQNASPLVSPITSLDLGLAVLDRTTGQRDFSQALVQYRSQEDIIKQVKSFTQLISSSSCVSAFAADLSRSLRFSQGEAQLANFWLLLIATQTALARKDSVSDFIDLPDDNVNIFQDHLEELYSFALSILADDHSVNDINADIELVDPRLQSLALRTLALRAQTAGPDFRHELIDSLYPVLHTLATPFNNSDLQSDALTTLDIFTLACGYRDVQTMIVENADYLTNAVALKLNAFDVSPQASQVLVMMIKLAGPAVLPFLEDPAESIFAILESFHGYAVLVDVFFRVLAVMAEEGAKAPLLAMGSKEDRTEMRRWMRERWKPITVDGLVGLLKDFAIDEADEKRLRDEQREQAPQRPWKTKVEEICDVDESDPGSQGTKTDEADLEQLEQQISPPPSEDVDPPPPAPKTYSLLFKITELTQHFLPSASPSLRVSLLSLIRTTIPAMARHENSFLPLINTLWPEIVSRLDDREEYVRAMALEIVGLLCEFAGEFMRSRIVQVWDAFREISWQVGTGDNGLRSAGCRDVARSASKAGTLVATDLKTNTPARLLWNALIDTLSTVAKTVPLPPELFDEVLDMLGPVLEAREDVRTALEIENEDAVWLWRMQRGEVEMANAPKCAGGRHWMFAPVQVHQGT
ncbi:HEAT repeat protein [Teratosphaeria destructans]|uniref:HEAT repeat protein n=1 Tax=Teratosphaeria destructans TaxID=418781 RepID=A0A9W7SWS2_9PEZI|nr:HEAT repeat protein [Teratosphaeria destructans]